MKPLPDQPPPGPDPRRVLREHEDVPPPAGEAAPRGDPGPPGHGPGNRERLLLIGLAALALGLGVSTAVLATSEPREVTTTRTSVSTEKLRPTTTTVVTEVLTTVTNTRTTTETTETVTETVTETATESGPPGQVKPKPGKPDKD